MTTPAPLKSLTLTAFRGSASAFSLSFEKGKKLTLIYGETVTVVAAPTILSSLGLQSPASTQSEASPTAPPPAFTDPDEMKVARLAYDAFRKLAREPDKVPNTSYLSRPEVQAQIVKEVRSQFQPAQMELEGIAKPTPDMAAVVAATAKLMADRRFLC